MSCTSYIIVVNIVIKQTPPHVPIAGLFRSVMSQIAYMKPHNRRGVICAIESFTRCAGKSIECQHPKPDNALARGGRQLQAGMQARGRLAII